jgi:3-methyladenine DNA glycosylase AlkD
MSGVSESAAIVSELTALENPRRGREMEWFYRTEPGGYGEGDRFLGLTVPQSRSVAANHLKASRADLDELFRSEFHEIRFCALVILTKQFEKTKDAGLRAELFEYYLSLYELGAVNSWDLVDVSANRFGRHLLGKPGAIELLVQRTRSNNLWVQRSAVILTFPMLAEFDFEPTLAVCDQLIDHPHDLIHKAVGWAMREVGKRETSVLREFLQRHAATMPRTALRYAIEKLSPEERADWLSRKARLSPGRGR